MQWSDQLGVADSQTLGTVANKIAVASFKMWRWWRHNCSRDAFSPSLSGERQWHVKAEVWLFSYLQSAFVPVPSKAHLTVEASPQTSQKPLWDLWRDGAQTRTVSKKTPFPLTKTLLCQGA